MPLASVKPPHHMSQVLVTFCQVASPGEKPSCVTALAVDGAVVSIVTPFDATQTVTLPAAS